MNTSKFMLKENLLRGDTIYQSLDSSLTNFEKVYDDEINIMTLQSLGNVGTTLYDIYNFYSDDFSLQSGL